MTEISNPLNSASVKVNFDPNAILSANDEVNTKGELRVPLLHRLINEMILESFRFISFEIEGFAKHFPLKYFCCKFFSNKNISRSWHQIEHNIN